MSGIPPNAAGGGTGIGNTDSFGNKFGGNVSQSVNDDSTSLSEGFSLDEQGMIMRSTFQEGSTIISNAPTGISGEAMFQQVLIMFQGLNTR
jgi:hypothetical protein